MKLNRSDKMLIGITSGFGFYICYQIWAETFCEFVINLINQII